jgi:acetyl esterase/lipase
MTRRTGLLTAFSALGATIGAMLSGCSASSVLDKLVPSDSHRMEPGVAYGPDARHQLDIYRPLQNPVGTGHPVVLFFYGGSWTTGERAQYRFVGEALARNGVLVLVADYRLSPQVRYPAFLQDGALAAQWVFANAARLGGDASRIHLVGHSAGAYNVAMLALDARWLAPVGLKPSQLAGWVGIAGPYDFLPIGNRDVQVAFEWPNTQPDTQPIAHVSAAAPRSLLLAANSDNLVNPQRNTVGLARGLQDAGASTRVRLFDRVNHVTVLASLASPLNWLAPVLPEVLAFVQAPKK